MSVLDELEFIFFHLMPYAPLPEGHQQLDSLWVDYPNSNFDPVTGHELYKRYWSELLLADKLGYDGVFVNEHHNTQFTMNAAPNLTAAAIIPHTSCRIGVYGTPPNFEYPNRLAEEYAMLDVMSGGRLEVAFPLGTGMEYWANSVNPATARARFREGLDVIFKAWTEPGPMSYAGEFYNYRYLNPWPTPYQKPLSAGLHRRVRIGGDRRARRRAGSRILGGVHPDQRAVEGVRPVSRTAGSPRPRPRPEEADLRGDGLRRRDRQAGPGRVHAALHVLLRDCPEDDAALSDASRVRHRSRVPQADLRPRRARQCQLGRPHQHQPNRRR